MGLSEASGFDFTFLAYMLFVHSTRKTSVEMLSKLPWDMDKLGQPAKKFRLPILNNSD